MASAGIGAKLREARERGGLSLRQVSDSTKIPTSLLQAIERNDASRLPGGLYSRGYVRSFALAVALDPEATVAEFVSQCPEGSVKDGYPAAERAAMAEMQQQKRAGHGVARRVRVGVPVLRRMAAVGALPAMLVIYLGTNGLPSWPAGQATFEVRHAGLGDMFAGGASPVQTGPSQASAQPPVDPLPSRFMEVRAEAIPVPPPAATIPVASSSAPLVADGTFTSDTVAIVLTARSPSWVIATVDGRRAVNRLLEPGSQETIEARRDLTLTLGDAGAVAMTLNGRPARPLGRAGESATAHVTNANFRTYLRR
jgi:transcriptional regulator with XRE-family HTH domain